MRVVAGVMQDQGVCVGLLGQLRGKRGFGGRPGACMPGGYACLPCRRAMLSHHLHRPHPRPNPLMHSFTTLLAMPPKQLKENELLLEPLCGPPFLLHSRGAPSVLCHGPCSDRRPGQHVHSRWL